MTDAERRAWVEALAPAMLDVGARLCAQRGMVAVHAKPDSSPVTEADLQSDAQLHAALSALAPQVPVISEERPPPPVPAARFFLLDPLDGTREFIDGRPDFAVCVALIEQGVPRLGLVGVPAEEAVYATWGEGLWRYRAGAAPERVTPAPQQPGPPIVAASRSHLEPQTRAALARFGAHRLEQRGSAVKFVQLACGAADLYPRLGPVKAWDIAAGQALVEAAGGVMLDIQGRPLRYDPAALTVPAFVAARSLGLAQDFLRGAAEGAAP